MRLSKDFKPKRTLEAKTKIPSIGKIKIGEKSEKGYPTSLDYFRFTTEQPLFQKLLETVLSNPSIGSKPKAIPVAFATEDDSYNVSYELHLRDASGKLAYRSDGKVILKADADGWEDITKACLAKFGDVRASLEAIEQTKAPKDRSGKIVGFKEVLSLRLVFLAFPMAATWEFKTSASQGSIDAILDAYDMVKAFSGSITNKPFLLTVEKVKSDRAGTAKQYPVVKLVPAIDGAQQVQMLQTIQANTNLLNSGNHE